MFFIILFPPLVIGLSTSLAFLLTLRYLVYWKRVQKFSLSPGNIPDDDIICDNEHCIRDLPNVTKDIIK